jgi:uncharacterized membrane protein
MQASEAVIPQMEKLYPDSGTLRRVNHWFGKREPSRTLYNGESRITALVDGIFAVAMTLLALDLKFPESLKFNTDSEVWRQLLALTGHFETYGLSFVVLGAFWIGHHSRL